jgi:hypothetical protein
MARLPGENQGDGLAANFFNRTGSETESRIATSFLTSAVVSYTNSTLILRVASIAYLLHSNELMILYRASSNWNAYYPTLMSFREIQRVLSNYRLVIQCNIIRPGLY